MFKEKTMEEIQEIPGSAAIYFAKVKVEGKKSTARGGICLDLCQIVKNFNLEGLNWPFSHYPWKKQPEKDIKRKLSYVNVHVHTN